MKMFVWQLYGNPQEIAITIGKISVLLKAPIFKYPDHDDLDYSEKYNINLYLYKTEKDITDALKPGGYGWESDVPRLGIIKPMILGKTSTTSVCQIENVGYFDFVAGRIKNQPSIFTVYELPSKSNFLNLFLTELNKEFEQTGFLKSTTDFKMQVDTFRYSDVKLENKDLSRELDELKKQVREIVDLRARVQNLEQEAKQNKAKQAELEDLRKEIFPTSNQLVSGAISIKEERLNALYLTQKIHYQNLHDMEKRAAYFGLNVPLEITNQISYLNMKIKEIDDEVVALQQNQKSTKR